MTEHEPPACKFCGGDADVSTELKVTLLTERARRKLNPDLSATIYACLECCERLGPAFEQAADELVADGLAQ